MDTTGAAAEETREVNGEAKDAILDAAGVAQDRAAPRAPVIPERVLESAEPILVIAVLLVKVLANLEDASAEVPMLASFPSPPPTKPTAPSMRDFLRFTFPPKSFWVATDPPKDSSPPTAAMPSHPRGPVAMMAMPATMVAAAMSPAWSLRNCSARW